MRRVALVFVVVLLSPLAGVAEEAVGTGPLRAISLGQVGSLLPRDTHVLIERAAIERFLDELEGEPPDWAAIYGHGHHDPGHDDRLFELNRARDAKREGRPALQRRIAFVWPGELSAYDPEAGGFGVVIGPKFNRTRWGVVRFKYEDLPGNLRAIPDRRLDAQLRRRMARQKKTEVFVVMSGRLVPEESIVYDFSHDQEGLGLIMPVVRVERIEYLLK